LWERGEGRLRSRCFLLHNVTGKYCLDSLLVKRVVNVVMMRGREWRFGVVLDLQLLVSGVGCNI
jgi:hypothetical protein